jgi:hypothetical protein
MEHLAGGPVEWSNIDHKPLLMLQQTRRIMRDIVLGLEYCSWFTFSGSD